MNRRAKAASKGLMHVALVGVLLSVNGWVARAEVEPAPTVVAPHVAPPSHDSLYGAEVLTPGHRVYGLESSTHIVGTFELSLKATFGVGLGGGVDLAAGFEASMPPGQHGGYEALTVSMRKAVTFGLEDTRLRAALQLEAVGAHFESPEAAENSSDGRHLSGYRDLNLGLAMPLTWGGLLGYYLKPEIWETLDLAPASNGPLTGAPPPYTWGTDFGLELGDDLRFGGGFPLRLHTAVRLMVHGRHDDKTVTFTTIVGFGFG